MMADDFRTRVSTKGQVIVPKAIRERRHWDAGVELTVEDTPDGVVLKSAPLFAPTRIEDVYGCLRRPGQTPMSLEDMDAAVEAEARRRYARDRY